MNLVDHYRGKISLRRMIVLVKGLPASSRVRAAMAGDENGSRWGDVEHLLAVLVDSVNFLTQVTAYKGSGRKPTGPPPPLPRPGDEPRRDPEADARAREYIALMAPGGPGTTPGSVITPDDPVRRGP